MCQAHCFVLGIIPHRILAACEIDTILIPLLQRSVWGLERLARWLKVLEPVGVKLGFESFQKVDACAMCIASDTFIQKHSPQGVLLPYNFRPLVLSLFSGKAWTMLALLGLWSRLYHPAFNASFLRSLGFQGPLSLGSPLPPILPCAL